ncbi:MAG: cytochrome c-type biogenesis protein CcmH [Bdellovibrionales bacterium]|nr:cytochrome c-type biogenesis protein CcmH [Bdellovibrionales bacterium]
MKTFWIILFCFSPFVWAQSALDQKASEMEKKLIAPCCWAKTLDQEQSEVAIYMKQKIKQQLAQGKNVEDIYAMFEQEFGERVLAEPKKSGFNWVVWFFPMIILCLGALLLYRKLLTETTPKTPQSKDIPDSTVPAEDQKYLDQVDRELYRQ